MGILYIQVQLKAPDVSQLLHLLNDTFTKIFGDSVSIDMLTHQEREHIETEQDYYIKINLKAIQHITPYIRSELRKLLQHTEKHSTLIQRIELLENTTDVTRFFTFKQQYFSQADKPQKTPSTENNNTKL